MFILTEKNMALLRLDARQARDAFLCQDCHQTVSGSNIVNLTGLNKTHLNVMTHNITCYEDRDICIS